jgi:arylsulfatase A-like enzyme
MASFAALTDQKLTPDDAPDSFDVLGALLNETKTGRDHLVEQAGALSLIKGDWKYIEPSKGAKVSAATNIELGNDSLPQLYNLKSDLGEKHNLAAEHPDIVADLAATLRKIKDSGHSRY